MKNVTLVWGVMMMSLFGSWSRSPPRRSDFKIYVMVTSGVQFCLAHQTIGRYTSVLFTSTGQSERLGLLLFVTPNPSFFHPYL